MTFEWPGILWLLLLVPLLGLIHLLVQRRWQRRLRRFPAVFRLADMRGSGPGFRRHVPAALFLLGTAVALVALARPSASVLLPGHRATVVLSLDVSGSMRATDIKPSRMEAVKDAARAFVNLQPPGVRLGVVAFSSSAFLVQAPTDNKRQVMAAIDRLRPQMFTAVGSGLLTALAAIFPALQPPAIDSNAPLANASPDRPAPAAPGSNSSAIIILLSDGQSNQGPDPLDAAQQAADLGIRVFTVGVGTREGTDLSFGGFTFHAILDEVTLKKIALITGGKYFRASDADELRRIYEGLGSQFRVERGTTEITALLEAVALALFILMGTLSFSWFNRLL